MTNPPFSYRNDPAVPKFLDDTAVLFFDGVCVLCTGFARYVLERDRHQVIRFCSAQSPLGQAIYRHYGLDPASFSTNILISRGRAYFKSEAFIETMTLMGWPYSLARLLRLLPRALRDWLYDPIARNRYRWFGERATCYAPGPEERERFLE